MRINNSYKPYQAEPETLYKYRPLSKEYFEWTRNIFLKNELYFPHPDQINDPFDCKVMSTYENVTKEMILRYLDKLSPLEYKNINLAKNNVRSHDLATTIQELKKKDKEGNMWNVGVLSFSEKKLDIRMWSHYSDSHRGICIGFDYAKMLFNFNGKFICGENVMYPRDNSYPQWNGFVDDNNTRIDKIYFTKSLDWEYEREWRIVFPEQGRTLQRFNPDALVTVHLGCQINKEHKEAVVNWCLQRKQKPKIYETAKDESSYSLKENEITY